MIDVWLLENIWNSTVDYLIPPVRPFVYMYVNPCAIIFLVFLWFTLFISVVLLDNILYWISHPWTWINCILKTVGVHWAHLEMTTRQTMFGEIFFQISSYRFPKDAITVLENSILYPIKTHIHGFCTFLMHLVVNDDPGSWFISLNGGCWLGIAHLFKGCYYWFICLGIV